MTDVETGAGTFSFLRNGESNPLELVWPEGAATVRGALGEALNARNVAFLLGAGCSSLVKEGREVGVPTMAPLAKEFCGETVTARAAGFYALPVVLDSPDPATTLAEIVDDSEGGRAAGYLVRGADGAEMPLPVDPDAADEDHADEDDPAPKPWRLTRAELLWLDEMGIDLEGPVSRNLERLMEILFGQRFVLEQSDTAKHWPKLEVLNAIIEKVQSFLWERISAGPSTTGDNSVRDLFEQFYRKLVLRDRSLPRPWVFTTNYDVFNETAMDRLGIPYANGFTGVVERRFNPASFRYALAEQLDVGNRKWTAVDAFVYLCKLHGSVTWTEDDHGLFPIREEWPARDHRRMLIYPTPAKQNASLASPYSDLFREFQSRIVREQSVLITAGYAFGDQHINNIIYQALTIPTFRLIVFASPDTPGEIQKLIKLGDPRVWVIGGDGPSPGTRAHYFATVIEHFMPQRPPDRIDDAVRKVLAELATPPKDEP